MTELLPVRMVARGTGIPESRIYRWIRSGRLPVVHGVRPSDPMRVYYSAVLDLEDERVANGGYLPLTPT